MAKNRVLVIIPTYEAQKELLEDVLINVDNQKYRNYDILVIINNSSLNYVDYCLKTLEKIEWEYIYKKKYKKLGIFKLRNIGEISQISNYTGSIGAQAFNYGLDYAINNNYDYVLLVAGDIALPDDSIKQLLKPFRKFEDCGIACLTCHYRWSGDGGSQNIIDKVMDGSNLKAKGNAMVPMLLPIEKNMTPNRYYKKKYLKVQAGDGAMMISRIVFKKIKMRTELKNERYGSDIAYCLDMTEQLGLWTYIVTDLWTPHMNIESDGKIVAY